MALHWKAGKPLPRYANSAVNIDRLAWVVLIVVVMGSIAAWFHLAHSHAQRVEERFLYRAEKERSNLVSRMQAYEQILRGGVAFFESSHTVSRQEWRRYVDSLDVGAYLPGIQGIGFARMIAPADKARHEQQMRAEGFPDYAITPPGVRAQYSSVVYLEPFAGRNLRAFGYDMYADPVRRVAMDLARDTGRPALSGRVTLIQEPAADSQPGFLMYAPLYRAGAPHDTIEDRRRALLGFVYSPFRASDLLRTLVDSSGKDVDFQLYDEEIAPARLLFDSRSLNPGTGTGRYRAELLLVVGGHHWVAAYQSRPDFDSITQDALPASLGVGGSLLGFLLFIGLRTYARHRRRMDLASTVFTHAQEGMLITDPETRIIEVNETFTRLTGYARADVLGQTPNLFSSGHHPREFYAQLWESLNAAGHWQGEIWNRRKSGEVYPEMLSIVAVRDGNGILQNYVAMFSDITAQKRQEFELTQIAHFDMLTGLPNRVLLADRIQQAQAQARRQNQMFALLYLDLDGFKDINDECGHEAGDHLLIVVSRRMKDALREADTLARLGGDEFVAILNNLSAAEECDDIVQRLLAAASERVIWRSRFLSVSASLGIALYPVHASDAETLLREADQAMYQAKLAGKNTFRFAGETPT